MATTSATSDGVVALLAAQDRAQLEQAAQHHRRNREQEREARRGGAVEAEEQARGDRGTRSARRRESAPAPGPSRSRCRRAGLICSSSRSRVPTRSASSRTRPSTISADADQVEVARAVLDLVLEGQAEDPDRDRAEMMYQPSPGVELAPRAPARRSEREPGARDPQQVLAEVEEHRGHRAELGDGGERRARGPPSRGTRERCAGARCSRSAGTR